MHRDASLQLVCSNLSDIIGDLKVPVQKAFIQKRQVFFPAVEVL